MKTIPLTQGKVAIVDDEDYTWLMQWKWHSSYGYAMRRERTWSGKQKGIFMHRVVNKTPLGLETDHINRNKLDNRKENLQSVTHQENTCNKDFIQITHKSQMTRLKNKLVLTRSLIK